MEAARGEMSGLSGLQDAAMRAVDTAIDDGEQLLEYFRNATVHCFYHIIACLTVSAQIPH